MRKHHPAALALLAGLVIIPALAIAPALSAAPQQQAAGNGSGNGSPAARDAAAAAYRLGPEDMIEVFVWQEEDISTAVMVRPDGRISLPLVNELVASGRTTAELQEEITEKLRAYIDNPVVSVMVREINSAKISVLGEVNDPGRFLLRQQTNVLDAIAMAGGFTEFANRGHVVIVRGDERIRVDVNDLVQKFGAALFDLRANDAVYVR